MTFLFFLILLNFILFLPRYIFGLPTNWNPLKIFFTKKKIWLKIKTIYYSSDTDPFRISMEYTILVILCLIIGIDKNYLQLFFTGLALFVFVFNIYMAIFISLLQRTPVLKSDWVFIKDSIAFFKGYFLIISTAIILLLVLLNIVFYWLHTYLLSFEFNPWISLLFLLMVLANGLYSNYRFGLTYYYVNYVYRSVFSIIIFISKSNTYSKTYDQLSFFSKEKVENLNLFTGISLRKKPNIHIISFESYGSLIFKNKDSYDDVRKTIHDWNAFFKASDIHVSSSYTVPPLFSKGTWYSYSTLLFGLSIDNAVFYDVLFKRMQNFTAYESLFHFTKREGYTNYLVSGLMGDFDKVLDLEKTKRNFNYDKLIYNTDLQYKGQNLYFNKIQKSIPDQYTINKSLELIQAAKKSPYTFFYTTLNSHFDFSSPLVPVDNWEELNQEGNSFKTTMDEKLSRNQRYAKSVNYTINTLFDIVSKKIDANDIFIIYGDHQPPLITDEKYGLETPIHIFSKDKTFISEWEQFGFSKGLIPQEGDNHLPMEGFYSAFMKCINKVYGEYPDLDVPYMKEGIKLF